MVLKKAGKWTHFLDISAHHNKLPGTNTALPLATQVSSTRQLAFNYSMFSESHKNVISI
jgi:hypothetical protein